MNNALTENDLSDLAAAAARKGTGDSPLLRASELDDGGEKLIGLGMLEVRVAAVHGVAGSERLGPTADGLDELFERGL